MRGAGALCLVLLQLVAGAVLPFADALLEGEGVGLPTHVESPHNADCPAAHDHLFCQVVRSLASASTSKGVGTVLDLRLPLVSEDARSQRDAGELRPAFRGPTTSRPPPLG